MIAPHRERRQLVTAFITTALAGFYLLRVWSDGAHAAPRQTDPPLFPYIGLMATAPVALILAASVAATRVAPRNRSTQLVQEVARYAALIGCFVGFGLLLPSLL